MRWLTKLSGSCRRAPASRRPGPVRLHLEPLERRDVPTTFTALQLDEAAQSMLQLINQARADPAAEAARDGIDLNEGLAAGTISTAAKQPLAPNADLMKAITAHLGVWLQSDAYWSANGGAAPPSPHTGLGDGTPASRISAAGYANATWYGENLAAQWQTDPVDDLQGMVAQLERNLFVDSSVAGRGHRLNLMNPNFQEAGVAIASDLVPAGSATGLNLVLAGQDFATDPSTPALGGGTAGAFVTGVVYTDTNGNGQYDLGEGVSGGGFSVSFYPSGSNQAAGSTTVSDAGAYSLKLASGSWTVTVAGGPLLRPQTTTVTVGASNVEADFVVPASNLGSPTLPAGFAYDSNSQTLTLTGTSIAYAQKTTADAAGLHTVYAFTVNGNTASLPDTAVAHVIELGQGNSAAASLDTSNTYVGTDGQTHETVEEAILGNGGGQLWRYDAAGNGSPFIQLSGFQKVYATAGPADFGLITGTPNVQNFFVSAGSYAYMTSGSGFYDISGAQYVYGFASNGSDVAYHYDGSGASALVISGTAYSFMLGTDGGKSFFNEAVGFTQNYGIAQHAGQDTAYLYDSANSDVFVGYTGHSFLYSDRADGSFAEFDYTQGFAQVDAYSFVGGSDSAYVYDATVNHVTGFHRLA